MALQYTTVSENDFSLGIDARSAENQINPGFVKDLLNADIVEKRIRNRRGYQGYAGNIPFRVTKLEYKQATNDICFTLDNAVDLNSAVSIENVRSSPIIVYGRSSVFTSGDGPFTDVDSVRYYSKFTVPLRKVLTAPSGTLSIEGSEHGIGTTDMFFATYQSLSLTNRSYQTIDTDSVAINETSFNVDVGYSVSSDTNVFAIFADKSPVTGSSYIHAATGTGTGTQTISIPAATHNLADFNILIQVQQDTGASRLIVRPESMTIDSSGNVVVTIENGTGSPQDYYIILSAAPVANQLAGSIGGNSSGTVIISGLTSPWQFYSVYLELTPGGTKELVFPDSIDYDDTTQSTTLSFTNGLSTARNFFVFFEEGSIRSNQLCVEDNTLTTSGIDSAPQLSLWGLEHDEAYPVRSNREGWATHIDSYRRPGEQRLICGLGGNLFTAREYSEAATQYSYPLLYPNLVVRTSAARLIAPLFWDTAETPARSRGYITSDNSADHLGVISAVLYDTGNGWTRYTISLPNKQILDSTANPTSLTSVISTTSNLEDWLTVSGMSYSRHEGTFRICQVLDGTDEIFIWVENDDNSSDFNDSGVAGSAGIFTDQLTWTTAAPFVTNDILSSEVFPDSVLIQASTSLSTTTVVTGVVDLIDVAAGVVFNGERTSAVIPLRTNYPTAMSSVANVVRGDMLGYTGPDVANNKISMARDLRVLYVNPDSDRTVNITVTDGTATATLTSGDTSYLTIGQQVLFTQGGIYSGDHEITAIVSTTEFEFSTDETTSGSATLLGNTIHIDEELDWADTPGDSNGFICRRRWIPLEAPDDAFDLTPSTHVRYFDSNEYSTQPFLRSTMVQDNMFLTNADDEVYKFDSSSNYRAGLIAWQPGAFLTQETTGATIVTDLRSIAYSATVAGQGKLTITAQTTNVLPIGSSVRLTGSTETYTLTGYTDDGTVFYALMDRALDASVSASGSIAEIGIYRHYYRLNAVDINSNIIASAVTGYQDHVIELTGNAAILHRLIGMPAWDVYDYDRLECEIYRTKMNQAAPFYKVATIPMSFDNTKGYISYRDSFADSDLINLDIVNTALRGAELGTNWSDALRAKYVTSVGNALVLGNVRDYPQLDIQIVAPANVSNSDFAGDSLLFRRDSEDTATTTDMPNRVRYQWINGFTGDASSFTIGTDEFEFTTSFPTAAVAGDWIYLTYSTVATTGRILDYSGWWQIADVTGTTVTVNLVGAAAAATYPDKYVIAVDPTDVPVLLGTDGNMGMVNGDSFDIFDSMRRMSMAINSTMRMTDISLVGMEEFSPWLVCRGGNDVSQAGRLLVRQPRSDIPTFEVIPTFSGYQLFINSVQRTSGSQITASTRTYPSRIIVSYPNYPEIFDSPTSILDTDSDSAIDINSADGQEITGVIPFFGQAAFTAAQQAAILIVFKTNSVYLVDINQKRLGNEAVQRIETEGLGCTAPYSIAVTKSGINFANESGIYCLRRDQSIQYLGRFMERNWTEKVDLNSLAMVQGHHYGVGRSYKISVPLVESIASNGYVEPSEAYVYNHTGEDLGQNVMGAWGRYDNHPSIGWANLASNAFFASTKGRVFILRNTGLNTDFRDDSSPIDMVLQLRPTDFGGAGIRKVVDELVIYFRVGTTSTDTIVSYAPDLQNEYSETTIPILSKPNSSNGMSDIISKDIITIRHDISKRRCVYMSIQIANSEIDESIEIAGVDFRVAGLSSKGILQAAQTR